MQTLFVYYFALQFALTHDDTIIPCGTIAGAV